MNIFFCNMHEFRNSKSLEIFDTNKIYRPVENDVKTASLRHLFGPY